MKIQIHLKWHKFTTWGEVCEDGDYGFPCVYAVTDKDRNPLYIGSTSRKLKKKGGKLRAGGLRGRYWSSRKTLDASMHGSGNLVFVAEVNQKQVKDVEAQLIYENQPKYNTGGKTTQPKRELEIRHEGESPQLANRHETT